MMADAGEILDTCRTFHRCIADTIKVVRQAGFDCPEMERLERIISLCKDEPTFIITRCKDKIWESRQQIKDKNVDYFFNTNFDKYIKKGSSYEDFQRTLMDMIKESWDDLDEASREAIWKYTRKMVRCVAAYRLMIGDFQEAAAV